MPATTRSSAYSKSPCSTRGRSARGGDRGLVADVRELGAGQAGRLARDQLEVDVLGQRLVPGVHAENRPPAIDVGRRHEDLPVEAARAQ